MTTLQGWTDGIPIWDHPAAELCPSKRTAVAHTCLSASCTGYGVPVMNVRAVANPEDSDWAAPTINCSRTRIRPRMGARTGRSATVLQQLLGDGHVGALNVCMYVSICKAPPVAILLTHGTGYWLECISVYPYVFPPVLQVSVMEICCGEIQRCRCSLISAGG